jgi:riboflavin synthase
MTNLQSLRPGDPVNIETDIVAKYLEKWMSRGGENSGITVKELAAKGF